MRGLVLAALLVLSPTGNPLCPRDGADSMWTGRTRVAHDPPYEMLYQYECNAWQHRFWDHRAPGTVWEE